MAALPIRITLSGDLGSGKSSIGRRLAATLGVPYFSAGALFRDIGQIDNLDALNTNLAAENNTAIDFAVDERTREIDRTIPSFVIDSRMAWHFVGNATRVFLSVSRDTAAHRILADGSRTTESYADHAAAVRALGERRLSETKRYRTLYGVDIADFDNYDLVVATDDAAMSDLAELVLAAATGEVREKFWLPKPRVVPMTRWRDATGDETAAGGPVSLVVVHNFGFYAGDAGPLRAALDSRRPFVGYRPMPSGVEGEALFARARRALTPGGLGQWATHAGLGGAFLGLLGPALP